MYAQISFWQKVNFGHFSVPFSAFFSLLENRRDGQTKLEGILPKYG